MLENMYHGQLYLQQGVQKNLNFLPFLTQLVKSNGSAMLPSLSPLLQIGNKESRGLFMNIFI